MQLKTTHMYYNVLQLQALAGRILQLLKLALEVLLVHVAEPVVKQSS